MAPLALLELVRLGLGALLTAVGIACLGGGAIGLLRFQDFYTRIHAATVTGGVGAFFVVAGLALTAADLGIALRLALLGALVVALSPALAHILASAGHAAGLAPLAGRYTAPRPGGPGPADQRQ